MSDTPQDEAHEDIEEIEWTDEDEAAADAAWAKETARQTAKQTAQADRQRARRAGTDAAPPKSGPNADGGYTLVEDKLPHFSPVCTYCAHWKPADGRSCAAFPKPNSIPVAIWVGQNTAASGHRHTQYVRGDHGIKFEVAPDAKAGAKKAGLI